MTPQAQMAILDATLLVTRLEGERLWDLERLQPGQHIRTLNELDKFYNRVYADRRWLRLQLHGY